MSSTTREDQRRTVVLTRQPVQAGHLEEGLLDSGLVDVRYLPLTDFVHPADPGHQQTLADMVTALTTPDGGGGESGVDVLLLTSPNTVRALLHAGLDPAAIRQDVRIAVTGPGTSRILLEATDTDEVRSRLGFQLWMPESSASAAGIHAELRPLTDPDTGQVRNRLLLPQSAAAGTALAEGLTTDGGWQVTHVVAYETIGFPAPATRQRILPDPTPDQRESILSVTDLDPARHSLVLTSSSAARAFHRAAAGTIDYPIIAIGKPTALTAGHLGLPLTATATTPDASGILDCVLPGPIRDHHCP